MPKNVHFNTINCVIDLCNFQKKHQFGSQDNKKYILIPQEQASSFIPLQVGLIIKFSGF